jgi:hypothetical protein
MALVVIVVAVRVALPYVLRPVLEDQISAMLNGRIEVDDIELSLLRGEAVVKGVRIYEGEKDELASFAVLLANIRWTALPFQQAVVEQIHLLSPVVHIVRDRDGEINLTRLPAPLEPASPPEESEPQPETDAGGGGWPAGLTLLALENATITFSDRTIENFDDIEFNVERLQIERAAYGGAIYDGDGKMTLVAEIAGAPLTIEAGFASDILSATSTGNFHVRDLNVGLGSRYAAQLLGWSDLRGALDIDLDFAAESGDAESPRIAIALRDFLIAVEGENEPALQWDSLNVAIQMANPQERFVRVSEVRLTNPVVRVRPAEEQPLSLLSRMDRATADDAAQSDTAGDEPEEAGEATAPDVDTVPGVVAGDSAPRWELDELVIEGARILVEVPDKTLDVGVEVGLTGLSSEAGDKAHLIVKTAIEGGTLDVDGEIGIAPVSFDGGIDVADLSLPSLLAVVPEPRAKLLRGGIARTDLDLTLLVKEGEDAPAVDATVSGTVGLSGLDVADDDPQRFSFTWDDLDVAIDGIEVRDGALAAAGAAAPVRIASVALTKPAFRGVRLEDGSIALPAVLGTNTAEGEAHAASETASQEVETVAVIDDGAGAVPAEPMPGIEVAVFRLTDGSLRIVDRAVQPAAKPGLKTFRLDLDGVHMPERRIDKLHFTGVGLRGGQIEAKGSLAGEATDIVLTIEKYRLVPYDPYAVTFSGYGIRRGMLSIESKVRLEGDDFDTHTSVIVHELGLKNTSGTTEFDNQIGVPISLALALLKDTQGDIKLDLPVSGNRQETNVGIAGIVAQQLKRILINALTSPLKLFGAVAGGDEVGEFSAARIAFADGGPGLSEKGRAQAEQLAELLRDRPELAIHLDVVNSLGDIRALQAAILLEELQAHESLEGDFAAIRSYLQARSDGEEAELPYHLEPILDEMLSRRRPRKVDLEMLSSSRVEVVRELMTGEFQVRPEQVIVEEQQRGGFVAGPAVVEAELGVVEEEEENLDESIG